MGFLINILKTIFVGPSVRSRLSVNTTNLIKREWEVTIDPALKLKSPAQLKQALISADKTLDNALRDLVPGETMGERLKAARSLFDPTVYDKLWRAHKVRNSLVHESGYEPAHFVLTSSIADIRSALILLGCIV